jgi:Peptidase M15
VIVLALACVGLERADPPRRTHDRVSSDSGSGGDPEVVCYPGVAWQGDACVLLSDAPSPAGDYVYPPPLDGSPLYAAPERFLDLHLVSTDLAIAPNFVLAEVADPADGDFAVVQVRGVEALQDLRDRLGPLIVTSGYRNPAHNADVGGVTWSRHQYGDAFDLVPVEVSLDTLGDACAELGASFVGVYETHRHCDWRDGVPDPAFFDAVERGAPPAVGVDAVVVRDGDLVRALALGWDEGEPLREWTALDASGWVLCLGWGRTFVPPEGTVTVSVVVGRLVERSIPW